MAAVTCPECGHELSSSALMSRRCLHCGATLSNPPHMSGAGDHALHTEMGAPSILMHAVKPEGSGSTSLPQAAPSGTGSQSAHLNPTTETPYSAESMTELADRVRHIAIRTACVCVVALAIFAFYLSRPTSATPPLPAGVATMVTDASSPAGNAGQAGTTGSPPSPQPAPSGADIAEYLTFLQKIDLQRVGLVSSVNQALSAAASNANSANTSAAGLGQSAQDLLRDFLAQKPPTDCSDLSNAYFRMLQDQTGMIGKAVSALASGDTRGAASAHDTASGQISSDAQSADAALTQLALAQHIEKPFSIEAEPSSAPVVPTPTVPAPTSSPAAAPPAGTAPASPGSGAPTPSPAGH